MCPIYSNGQPMDCKFPRGVCLAQDLIIPLFKLVISRKYARDFSVECNQSPYLYNEHDLWLYYADSSHPSLSQQESIYQNSVFTPNHTSSRLSVQWLWLLEWNLQKQKAQSAPHNDFHNHFLLSYCFRQSRKWQIFIFFFEWQIQFKMQIWEWRPSFTRLMNNKFSCSSILKSQFKFLFCTNTALHPHRQSAYLAIK